MGENVDPIELPLLPLRDVVVYPHMVIPLFVGRERSILALEEAMANDKLADGIRRFSADLVKLEEYVQGIVKEKVGA